MPSGSKSPRAATNSLLSLPPELFLLIAKELKPGDRATLIACSRTLTQVYAPLLTTSVDEAGEGLLAVAIAKGYHALARTLLTHGADPNLASCFQKLTPLHYAAVHGDVVATRLLLDFGADPNARASEDATPLHFATASDKAPLVVSELLRAGADINSSTLYGETALHLAARRCNTKLARVLLEAGANFNLVDTQGWLPLHVAAHEGSAGMIEVLVDAGSPLDAGDTFRETPLNLASWLGHIDAVRMLLRKGADVEGLGSPAIYKAAARGHAEVVSVLLEAGASKDLGETVFDACTPGNAAVVKVLVESGKKEVRQMASVVLLRAMEKDQENPGMAEIVQVLLDAGIVVDKWTMEFAPFRGLHKHTDMIRRYDADLAKAPLPDLFGDVFRGPRPPPLG